MFLSRGLSVSLIACVLLLCFLVTVNTANVEGSNLKAELTRLLKLKKQLKSKWNPKQYLNERILRIAHRFKIVIPRRCKRRLIIDDEIIKTIKKLAECDKETTPELPPPKQPERPVDPVPPVRPPVTPSQPSNPSVPTTPNVPSTPTTPSVPSTPSNPTTPSVPSQPTTPSEPSNPTVPVPVPQTPSVPEQPSQPSNPSQPSQPPGNPYVPPTPTVHCKKKYCSNLNCKQGYLKDSNGCQTCICKPVSCPKIACGKSCPHGFVTDSRGCPTCTCKINRIACARVHCRNSCRNGYVYNAHGCRTCTCNPSTPTIIRPPRPHPHPPIVRPPRPHPHPPVRPPRPHPHHPVRPPIVRPPRPHHPVRPPRPHPPIRPPIVRPPRPHPPIIRPPPRVIRPTPVAPPPPPRVIVRPPPPPPPRPQWVPNRGPNAFVWGVARGDPHYVLLSTGKEILFNGIGDYILAESEDKEFVAHVRIGKWHKKATVNTAIAVKLGSDIVEFNSKTGNFYLNKEESEFKVGKKYQLDGGYVLRKTKKTFLIKSIDGAELFGERFTLHDGKSYMDIQVDAPKELEFKRGLVIDGKGKQGKGLFRNEKEATKLPNAAKVVDIPDWAMEACEKKGLTGRKLTDCAYDAAVSGEEYADEIAKDEAKFDRRSKQIH